MKNEKHTACRSTKGEISASNRATNPSVRLGNKLGKLPNRKPLGDPYKR